MSGQTLRQHEGFGLVDIIPTKYTYVPPGEIEHLLREMADQPRRTGIGQLAAVGIGAMLNHLAQTFKDLGSLANAADIHPIWLAAVLEGLILPEEAKLTESVRALRALGRALNWPYERWPIRPWEKLLEVTV
jgi:hypothetical protein